LQERSLAVVCEDVGAAAAVAMGLAALLEPLEWAGSLIPTLPAALLDVLSSPVPYLVGLSTRSAEAAAGLLDAEADLGDLAVLMLDRPSTQQLRVMQNRDSDTAALPRQAGPAPLRQHPCNLPMDPVLSAAVEDARGLWTGANADTGAARMLARLSNAELAAVAQTRAAVEAYVRGLCGDLCVAGGDGQAWRRYGELNSNTMDFEFVPAWWLDPLERRLRLQRDMAKTQGFMCMIQDQSDGGAR